MQHLEVSGAVRPIYGSLATTHIWVVRRQTVKYHAMNTYRGVEIRVLHILNRCTIYTSVQPQAPPAQLLYPSQTEKET